MAVLLNFGISDKQVSFSTQNKPILRVLAIPWYDFLEISTISDNLSTASWKLNGSIIRKNIQSIYLNISRLTINCVQARIAFQRKE